MTFASKIATVGQPANLHSLVSNSTNVSGVPTLKDFESSRAATTAQSEALQR